MGKAYTNCATAQEYSVAFVTDDSVLPVKLVTIMMYDFGGRHM